MPGHVSPAFIDWDAAFRFKKSEFPEDPELYAEPALIYALHNFAVALGRPVYPSPVKGALARLDGDEASQHYAVGRKSTACDIFCSCKPLQAFCTAVAFSKFGGIGLYFDTQFRGEPWVMLHLDIRSRVNNLPVIWLRHEKTGYQYAHKDMEVFWKNLTQFLLGA